MPPGWQAGAWAVDVNNKGVVVRNGFPVKWSSPPRKSFLYDARKGTYTELIAPTEVFRV